MRGPRRRPLPAGQDPFYEPPIGFAAAAPGTVLRSRSVRIALLAAIPQRITAWQLLYRTCDLSGVPDATVTTVVLPGDVSGPVPLLAYQCAIDAISSRCFPSYALRYGAFAPGSVPQVEWPIIVTALRRGWVVTISDHGGPRGSFGAPREPGYRVLDAIRATLGFAPAGLSPETPTAAWGYSGGGMATSWVAELAPSYAPEIALVGAVLGSPVGDPGDIFARLNAGPFAGLPLLVVTALRRVYPELDRLLRAHSEPAGIAAMDRIETCTTTEALVRYRGVDLTDYLDRPVVELFAIPPIPALFDELRLGERAPACPLLVQQAVRDEVIAVENVDGQVERYRRAGVHVEYVRVRFGGHISEMFLAPSSALAWLSDRYAGRPLGPGGTGAVASSGLSGTGIRGVFGLAAAAFLALVGRPAAGLVPGPFTRFIGRTRRAA